MAHQAGDSAAPAGEFVTRNGTRLELGGTPFRFMGTWMLAYQEMSCRLWLHEGGCCPCL